MTVKKKDFIFIFLVLESYGTGKFKKYIKQHIRSFSNQYFSQKKSVLSVHQLDLSILKWMVLMILKNRELLTELNALLFVQLEMLVQHFLIDIGLRRKSIVRFNLSQTGGKTI